MRAPYQVLVIPYCKIAGQYQYAIFSRADMNCWQWIAGGGEDYDESVLASAKREAFEEAGIPETAEYMKLDTKTSIPVSIFKEVLWGDDVYVIDEHCFGVHVTEEMIQLSHEHKAYQWVSYEEACDLLKYDSNRTALWELKMRLERLENQ